MNVQLSVDDEVRNVNWMMMKWRMVDDDDVQRLQYQLQHKYHYSYH